MPSSQLPLPPQGDLAPPGHSKQSGPQWPGQHWGWRYSFLQMWRHPGRDSEYDLTIKVYLQSRTPTEPLVTLM